MRKNKMMRAASALLVATLLTTSVISGTFAKYTTQDSASDVARVAKWGVELQVAGDLYSENYAGSSTNNIAQVGTSGATVQTMASGENLVAPGTKNDNGLIFSLNGQPEVSGKISATIKYENIYLKAGTYGVMVKYGSDGKMTNETYNTIMSAATTDDKALYTLESGTYKKATTFGADTVYYTLEDYVVLGNVYYPVEYQLIGTGTNKTDYNIGYAADCNTDTLKGAVDVIGTAVFGGTGTASTAAGVTTVTYTPASFNPKTNLAEAYNLTDEKLCWKWDFEQTVGSLEGDDADVYCKADTILGNLVTVSGSALLNGTVVKLSGTDYVAPVVNDDYHLNTSLSIDITVTQVD